MADVMEHILGMANHGNLLDRVRIPRPSSPTAPASGLARSVALAVLVCVMSVTLAACRPDDLSGYIRANPEDSARIAAAVTDYYAIRSTAFRTRNLDLLWSTFPALQLNSVPQAGVNADADLYQRLQSLGVAEVRSDPQAIEPIKVFVNNQRAVAFVHGREAWMFPVGNNTGLEIRTVIELTRRGGLWIIEKTDETTVAEKIRTPPP